MDYLSSMNIDNEMDLEEKQRFVEKIRSDRSFYIQTMALLDQERELGALPGMTEPPMEKADRPTVWTIMVRLFNPLGFAVAGFTAAVLLLLSLYQNPAPAVCTNRFVLFEPAAGRVELVGTFTEWRRIALQPIGTSGYWEINLPVPSGEHRFAYILDGSRQLADPTRPASEKDDFGGENSILNIGDRI
jgi:hypothetical protein